MSNGLLFIGVILLGFLLAWGVSIFNKNNRTSSNDYLDNWQIDLFEKDEYDNTSFEEEELEEDDYYYDDDREI